VKAPELVIDNCSKLNPVYIDTRYPDYTEIIPAELYYKIESETSQLCGGPIL